jgi:hypothetical protein
MVAHRERQAYHNDNEEEITMTTGNFEVSGSPNLLSGTIEAEVYEVGGASPTSIIRVDQDWLVRIKWALRGTLKSMICGKWCLHVHLESIGKGPELDLPHPDGREIHIPLNPCGNGEYCYDFLVRAGTIRPEHCSTPFKVVTTVTYENACHKPGPMAGFVEFGILQFYDPGEATP